MKFTAKTDNPDIPCARGATRFILAKILAPPSPENTPRTPADISLVLDRSGSMAGGKFVLASKAVKQAIELLKPTDTLSVVVYDNEIDVIQSSTPATAEAKRHVKRRLHEIGPRGGTNLGEGWLTGCGQVGDVITDERVGRCLLLTDGLANNGITSATVLAQHAAELRSRGVSTSTFGVGADFDERLLGKLADAGGGAFTFCERADQIPQFIQQELGETLEIVARGVVIEVDLPLDVQVRPVGVFPMERTDTGVRIQLPDLVSEQDLEVPIEVIMPPGRAGSEVSATVRLVDRDDVFGHPQTGLSWQLVDAPDCRGRVDSDVQAIVAERLVALALEEATALNGDGRYDEAIWRLEEERVRLVSSFVLTDEIEAMQTRLRRAARTLRHRMDPMERKRMHYTSISLRTGGSSDGVSRKRSWHS